MHLTDLISRAPRPIPWTEGEKIPWNDPAFSARMLKEHLSQDHDAASRRFAVIDRQVDWISSLLPKDRQPVVVLDLACGPGLYTSRLARRGCRCTGIDFSPASIAHARRLAAEEKLDCAYLEGDLRAAPFGSGFDVAMFIFGEPNVFHPQDLRIILQKARAALVPGGLLLLEPHTFEAVRELGQHLPEWYTTPAGLFSEDPHLYLQENFWDEATGTTTNRYFIVDARTGLVTPYGSTMQAYTRDAYRSLLEDCAFRDVEFHPSLEGKETEYGSELIAIIARK